MLTYLAWVLLDPLQTPYVLLCLSVSGLSFTHVYCSLLVDCSKKWMLILNFVKVACNETKDFPFIWF